MIDHRVVTPLSCTDQTIHTNASAELAGQEIERVGVTARGRPLCRMVDGILPTLLSEPANHRQVQTSTRRHEQILTNHTRIPPDLQGLDRPQHVCTADSGLVHREGWTGSAATGRSPHKNTPVWWGVDLSPQPRPVGAGQLRPGGMSGERSDPLTPQEYSRPVPPPADSSEGWGHGRAPGSCAAETELSTC